MRIVVLSLCALFIVNGNSISIQFFEDEHLTNFILESNSTAGCNNIWYNGMDFVEAFLKTDTCLMVYKDPNCQSKTSEKILPEMDRDVPFRVESFHICNINEGGSRLTIDITEYYDKVIVPNVIQRFRNVCSCVNVPNNILQLEMWSINNHGNEIMAYFEPDCKQSKSTPQIIAAGNNRHSRILPTFGNSKVQSFGPIRTSLYFTTSCNPDLVLKDQYIQDLNRLAEADERFGMGGQIRIGNSTEVNGRAQIEFYARTKFKEFLLKSEATEPCNNLPQPNDPDWVTNKIESIKTNKCVICYTNNDCKGESVKIESPGIPDMTTIFQFVKGTETRSFHLCNNIVGGLHLNVDITEGVDMLDLSSAPRVLQSYRDICSCQKIPQFILKKLKWSISNYANSMIVYFEPSCKTDALKPLWIPAGHSKYSAGVGHYGQTEYLTGIIYRVQSFGPDFRAQNFKTHCIKLDSVIVKFEILEPDDGISTEQNMEMTASKTVFRNNSPAQLSQTYSASTEVHESFDVEIGSGLSDMNSVQVDTTLDIETKKGSLSSTTHSTGSSQGWSKSHTKSTNETKTWNAGGRASLNWGFFKIGGGGGVKKTTSEGNQQTNTVSGSNSQGFKSSNSVLQEDKIKKGLRNAYETSATKSTSSSFRKTEGKNKKFEITQQITVPPCSEHVVSGYVKVVTNKHVEYRALTKISGEIGGEKMISAQVRKFMDSKLEYVEDFDDNTVLAYSMGSFRAEYGISAFISADGSTLHDCMEKISGREKNCPKCDCSTGTATKTTATSLAHPFMAYAGMF